MEWQTVDTAPKDGREILTYRKVGLIAVAFWCESHITFTGYDFKGWMVSDGMGILDVTHWMQLPEPPK